jgi:hypothetical protein
MPSVAYENTYMLQSNPGTGTMLLPAPKAERKDPAGEIKSIERTMHDFRSSLNVIMGYSELMLDGALGNMTREQRDGLRDILTCSHDMLGLINDVAIWQGNRPGSKR